MDLSLAMDGPLLSLGLPDYQTHHVESHVVPHDRNALVPHSDPVLDPHADSSSGQGGDALYSRGRCCRRRGGAMAGSGRQGEVNNDEAGKALFRHWGQNVRGPVEVSGEFTAVRSRSCPRFGSGNLETLPLPEQDSVGNAIGCSNDTSMSGDGESMFCENRVVEDLFARCLHGLTYKYVQSVETDRRAQEAAEKVKVHEFIDSLQVSKEQFRTALRSRQQSVHHAISAIKEECAAQISRERSEAEAALAAVKKQSESWSWQASKMQQEVKATKKEFLDSLKRERRLEEAINEMKEEYFNLRIQKEEAEVALDLIKQERNSLSIQNRDALHRSNVQKYVFEMMRQECTALRGELKEAQRNVIHMSDALEATKRECTALRRSEKEVIDECAKLREKGKEAQQVISALRVQLKVSEQQRSILGRTTKVALDLLGLISVEGIDELLGPVPECQKKLHTLYSQLENLRKKIRKSRADAFASASSPRVEAGVTITEVPPGLELEDVQNSHRSLDSGNSDSSSDLQLIECQSRKRKRSSDVAAQGPGEETTETEVARVTANLLTPGLQAEFDMGVCQEEPIQQTQCRNDPVLAMGDHEFLEISTDIAAVAESSPHDPKGKQVTLPSQEDSCSDEEIVVRTFHRTKSRRPSHAQVVSGPDDTSVPLEGDEEDVELVAPKDDESGSSRPRRRLISRHTWDKMKALNELRQDAIVRSLTQKSTTSILSKEDRDRMEREERVKNRAKLKSSEMREPSAEEGERV